MIMIIVYICLNKFYEHPDAYPTLTNTGINTNISKLLARFLQDRVSWF